MVLEKRGREVRGMEGGETGPEAPKERRDEEKTRGPSGGRGTGGPEAPKEGREDPRTRGHNGGREEHRT